MIRLPATLHPILTYDLPSDKNHLTITGVLNFYQERGNPEFGEFDMKVFANGAAQTEINTNGIEMKDVTFDSCSLYQRGVKIGKYYTLGFYDAIELSLLDDKAIGLL
jgi:hypothetical protein